MNKDVRLMVANPGIYAISNDRFELHGRYAMVEVADGVVYQLNKNGARDGVLSTDGWNPDTRVYVTGPDRKLFVRLGAPDDRVTVWEMRP
jgi:hypothetical protein